MSRRLISSVLFLVCLAFPRSAQLASDPLPYAPIANPLSDTLDQLLRDSATIRMGRVRVNQAGYRPQDAKYFYFLTSTAPAGFTVISDVSSAAAGTGAMTATGLTCASQIHIRASNNAQTVTGGDTRYTMDGPTLSGSLYEGLLPSLPPGRYRVVVGADTSSPFVVDESVYGWVRDALLKFFGVNRCGDSQSWFHPACHVKDGVTGGWHDCGDHLKESITQSFTFAVLGLASAVFADRDDDHYAANQGQTVVTDGIPDMLSEAMHGAEYVARSNTKAGGAVGSMVTAIGDFGMDHSWWGRPEYQDNMPVDRGGPPRAERVELGANVMGDFAAGMAFTSRRLMPYDSSRAATYLRIAKNLYTYAKINRTSVTSTPAYNGSGTTNDELALAAVALLWATGDSAYLNDLCRNTTIGTGANTAFPKLSFAGGWFAYQPQFSHDHANTDWGSVYVYALWAFYRLILDDAVFCTSLGISSAERLALMEKTAYQLIYNLSAVGQGSTIIDLPDHGASWGTHSLRYEKPWMTMYTQQEWVWNRYQAGNITELYCYQDVASRIQGVELPHSPASTDWKAGQVREVLVRQLDYMLGVNPWDVSMIYGVGEKNFNHPHHRAANPEGKNVPGAFYRYRPPVGALQGGYLPSASALNVYSEHYDDYYHSEIGIDGSAAIFIPVVGLAKAEPTGVPPSATVRIVYVGYDNAIIEVRQSRYGPASVRYGVAPASPTHNEPSDSNGVLHRFELTGLSGGTTYNFDVVVSDLPGNDTVITDHGAYFTFTTLTAPPAPAQITNVKVCRVTADSAEIFWYTPNGAYDSKVVYGTATPPSTAVTGDVAGHPTQFHYVKIGGLREKTTYYFYVESNGTRDDNGGAWYSFTTPVTFVNFDIRALSYGDSTGPFLGINVVNQDSRGYDSLDLRIYLRGTEEEMKDFAAAVDIGIKYNSAGFQDAHFKGTIDPLIQVQKPQKMADTYDPATGTYAWYLSLPLGGTVMESGARFRIDLRFRKRNLPWNDDLLMGAPTHVPSTMTDWSWMAHRVDDGAPVDFPGIPAGTKENLDNNYWNVPVDPYICVYRKGEFVYGFSPSYTEQKTKRTDYRMTSQVISPLMNPSEEYVALGRTVNSITVQGWATISDGGVINDLWVNGSRVSNPGSVISYDASTGQWIFAVPVPMHNGGNEVDITIFGGPDQQCTECYGCAYRNHHFHVSFKGAQAYASSLRLLDTAGSAVTSRVARIDTTRFLVEVTDRNGNQNAVSPDTVRVTVRNPFQADSLDVLCVETGDSTGVFVSPLPVAVTRSGSGALSIAMAEGDVVYVVYQDPSDPSDASVDSLYVPASWPVPVYGWYMDSDGNGAVDRAAVVYDKSLTSKPDSLVFHFPDAGTSRSVAGSAITIQGISATAQIAPSFAAGVTSYTGSGLNLGMSYLTTAGRSVSRSFTLYDSAGPVLKSGAVVEDPDTSRHILTITFSEAIPESTLDGATLLLRGNTAGSFSSVEVLQILGSSVGGATYTVAVSPPAHQGDSLKLTWQDPAVRDAFGNRPHAANPPVVLGLQPAPPRIVRAAYFDRDADGFVDTAVIWFNKRVDLADIEALFDWGGIRRTGYLGDSSLSCRDGDSSTVIVNLTGAFPAETTPRTSGMMFVSVKYLSFQGAQSDTLVADSAAPVIVRAEYRPCAGCAVGELRDTLVVEFSETTLPGSSASPFLLAPPNGTPYSLTLSAPALRGAEAIFIAAVTDRLPGARDSIWINHVAGVRDSAAGVVQDDPQNRRVVLIVKTVEVPWTLTVSDNPFAPGPGGQKTALTISALDGRGSLVGVTASIKIFDAVGNTVLDRTPLLTTPNGGLSFSWDGRNRSQRYVGTGTYLAVVTVKREGTAHEMRRALVGVKR